MNVKIGCNTLYLDGRLQGEEHFTLDQHRRSLDLIAAAGFDAVEFSHAAPLTTREQARASEHARSLGLIPWSVHAWTALAGSVEQIPTVIERYRQAAETARTLGTRVVVVHSGGNMDPAGLEGRAKANGETLLALAEMVGPEITIAVENCGSQADWQWIIEMVDRCPAPNVGLNIDTGHANIRDLGVVNAIQMAGGRIRTTHIQDNFGERDDHLPPGKGQIDWIAALTAFRDAGYNGVYMVEISDCPPNREPDAVADTRTAAQNLRGFLEQIGE